MFADRVEVWNPGELLPPLTPASLREPHRSVLRNPRLCEALFLARYIEKYGTGTLMMIRRSIERALPEPDFVPRGGEFGVTLWRDWLTEAVLARLGINDRQQVAIAHVKVHGAITNSEYQRVTGATRKTSTRDLADLVKRRLLDRVGTRKSAHYVVAKKRDTYGTYGTSGGSKGSLRPDRREPGSKRYPPEPARNPPNPPVLWE